jgi:hypothetical protein
MIPFAAQYFNVERSDLQRRINSKMSIFARYERIRGTHGTNVRTFLYAHALELWRDVKTSVRSRSS